MLKPEEGRGEPGRPQTFKLSLALVQTIMAPSQLSSHDLWPHHDAFKTLLGTCQHVDCMFLQTCVRGLFSHVTYFTCGDGAGLAMVRCVNLASVFLPAHTCL